MTVADGALDAVVEALTADSTAGGGVKTEACHALLRRLLPGTVSLLTTSCTDALELAALAMNIQAGDEVIMPSWTFTSTANAFALRGAIPVFVDVEHDTLNISISKAAEAVTSKTRAIVCVHYAGVACEMQGLIDLCKSHGLVLIEDAAQAYGASWRGVPAGAIGDLGTYSFHSTKNVSCGEGGALIVRRPEFIARAEVGWEKGTNRLSFSRNEVSAYDWQDLGSSFLPSEVTAALLIAELAQAGANTQNRLARWNYYKTSFIECGVAVHAMLPYVPNDCAHNAHIFALRFDSLQQRDAMRTALAVELIDARSHYQPLHLSPAGLMYGRTHRSLAVTEKAAGSILRLPLYNSICREDQDRVIAVITRELRKMHPNGGNAMTKGNSALTTKQLY